jgi:phosphate transport system substrate-binding protein
VDLIGAGSTFAFPALRLLFAAYAESYDVRVNYLSLGSGEGIRLLLEQDVDFAFSDRPLRPLERSRARCGLLELPALLGAVSVVYHLPDDAGGLRLDPELLADIFLGRIEHWDDPRVRRLNPTRQIPDLPIRVVFRARTSGTSEVFAAYLDAAPRWRAHQAGRAELDWPVGASLEGNEGVAGQVQVTPGAIGFAEFSYAHNSRLSMAAIKNVAGSYVLPAIDGRGIARAVEGLLDVSVADTVRGLVSSRAADAYPIVGVSRLLADQVLAHPIRAEQFVDFARWMLSEGAMLARGEGFVPLPDEVAATLLSRLETATPGRCPLVSREPASGQ